MLHFDNLCVLGDAVCERAAVDMVPPPLPHSLDLFWCFTLPVVQRGRFACVSGVCLVCGSVCEGSGVVLFAPREFLKVVTGGEKSFLPP